MTIIPAEPASFGRMRSLKSGLLSRSGLTSSTSTASAAISAPIASQSSMFAELIVRARIPARSAAAIWLRMSASSGDTITVGPAPRSRSSDGRDEVDGGLAPPGALDDQGAAPVDHERLDRAPLIGPQPGLRPGQRAQAALGCCPDRVVPARRRRGGRCAVIHAVIGIRWVS